MNKAGEFFIKIDILSSRGRNVPSGIITFFFLLLSLISCVLIFATNNITATTKLLPTLQKTTEFQNLVCGASNGCELEYKFEESEYCKSQLSATPTKKIGFQESFTVPLCFSPSLTDGIQVHCLVNQSSATDVLTYVEGSQQVHLSPFQAGLIKAIRFSKFTLQSGVIYWENTVVESFTSNNQEWCSFGFLESGGNLNLFIRGKCGTYSLSITPLSTEFIETYNFAINIGLIGGYFFFFLIIAKGIVILLEMKQNPISPEESSLINGT